MIVYSMLPIPKDKLMSNCPSYVQSQEIIGNQAYYSMMKFKKNAKNLKEAEDLRESACLSGCLKDVKTIDSILELVDMNKLISIIIGFENTDKTIKQLRSEFFGRLNNLNK